MSVVAAWSGRPSRPTKKPAISASHLVAMGLGGVPLSIAVTALAFFTWLFTALLHEYLLVWVPTVLLQVLLGTGVLLLAAALSIPLSAQLIKPLRGLFVKHHARRSVDMQI